MCLKCGCLFSFKTVLTQAQRPFLQFFAAESQFVCVCVYLYNIAPKKLKKSDKTLFKNVWVYSKMFVKMLDYNVVINCVHVFAGLVTTTSRKLDREQQDEHILEVKTFRYIH